MTAMLHNVLISRDCDVSNVLGLRVNLTLPQYLPYCEARKRLTSLVILQEVMLCTMSPVA